MAHAGDIKLNFYIIGTSEDLGDGKLQALLDQAHADGRAAGKKVLGTAFLLGTASIASFRPVDLNKALAELGSELNKSARVKLYGGEYPSVPEYEVVD